MSRVDYEDVDVGRLAFADESQTHGSTKCYGIGVFSIESSRSATFEVWFEQLRRKHNIIGELKWQSIGNRFSDINLIIELTDQILRSQGGYFDVIVVNTALYNKWMKRDGDREEAFYVTYTELLKFAAGRGTKISEIFIDDRADSYHLHHEAMEIIGNRMLAQCSASGRLGRVRKVPSVLTPGVQVADLLTGLVVAGHARKLDPRIRINNGKRIAIERVARVLGWDDICYDTFPNEKFNIWHFPIEYRRTPKTMQLSPCFPEYVSREDLK